MFTQSNYEAVGERKANRKEALILETYQNETFITCYDIDHKDNPVNPRVVSPEAVLEKLSADRVCETDIIDSRILVNTKSKLVWHYTPSPKQPLYYRYNNHSMATPIQWCSFVLKRQGQGLSIAVVRSKQRPTLSTRLYRAPLPNVYQSGQICLGSCVLPDTVNVDAISEEYLNSAKTHLIYKSPLRGQETLSDTELFTWLQSKITAPIRVSELAPFGTLADFIK